MEYEVKFKGVWTPQYITNKLSMLFNNGATIQQIENMLGAWALDTVEENQTPPAYTWTDYDFNNADSRPNEYGKYFVHRKDGKVHWETWNGSGWAYNGDVITHFCKINPPTNI